MQYLAEPTAAILKLKDVDMHYNQNLEKPNKHIFFPENVWSEAHVFVWLYLSFLCLLFSFDI